MSGLSDVFGSTTNWLIVSSVVGVCLLFMLLVRQVKHARGVSREIFNFFKCQNSYYNLISAMWKYQKLKE